MGESGAIRHSPVTHLDVTADDVQQAVDAVAEELKP